MPHKMTLEKVLAGNFLPRENGLATPELDSDTLYYLVEIGRVRVASMLWYVSER